MKRLVLMGMGYLLLFGVSSPLRAGMIYDAAADFSLASNPNGAWTYGFFDVGEEGFYGNSFTTTFGNSNISSWGIPANDWGLNSLIAKNLAATTQQVGPAAILLPGELALMPSADDQIALSFVRWIAPDSGTISLSAVFEERDPRGGETASVSSGFNFGGKFGFSANVNGFGPSSDQSFSGSVSVKKGDQLFFDVFNPNTIFEGIGVGPTIGLSATIDFSPAGTTVPEPSSILLLGMGGVGFAVCGWRRRKKSSPARVFVGHGVLETIAKQPQEQP